MTDPQPIATAPKNGKPILTDEGIVRWASATDGEIDGLNESVWVACYLHGGPRTDFNNMLEVTNPTKWAPLPAWMQ